MVWLVNETFHCLEVFNGDLSPLYDQSIASLIFIRSANFQLCVSKSYSAEDSLVEFEVCLNQVPNCTINLI